MKEKNAKCTELGQQITALTKQQKERQAKNSTQAKTFNAQINELNAELEKKKRENQAKAATISKYGLIQSELRVNIAELNKQVSSLKQVN